MSKSVLVGVDRRRDSMLRTPRVFGGWFERFVAEKRLGQHRRGIVVKETSLAAYGYRYQVLLKHGLNLETCTLDQVRSFLGDYQRSHKPLTYINQVAFVKEAVKFLDRDFADSLVIPKRPDPAERVKDQLIEEEKIKKLIEKAPTLRDRVLLLMLFESGARRGELVNLRIKDVQPDQVSGRMTYILTLTGKSGTRRRRIYEGVPDIRRYLNEHPNRDDPNAHFFISFLDGHPLTGNGIYLRVKFLSRRILGTHLHPHSFRHTRATVDSNYFSDRQLMKLYGWKKTDQVATYSHLTMKDVDDADLVLHGLKNKEEVLGKLIHVLICPKCKNENSPVALYCQECGMVLAGETQQVTDLRKEVEILRLAFQQLAESVKTNR